MKRWIVELPGPFEPSYEAHGADRVVLNDGTLALYKTNGRVWQNGQRVENEPDLLVAWASGQWLSIVPDE